MQIFVDGDVLMSRDYIGTVVNKFEILDFKRVRQPKGYYYQYYLARCPHCQKIKWMLRGTIDDPNVASCGCKRIERFQKSADIKGKTFGKLTALYPTGEGGNFGNELWLCECECGNTIKERPNHLNWGWVTNCGCIKVGASGHKYISRKNEKWQARPVIGGKRVYLGVFDEIEDAITAIGEAEKNK